MIEFGQAAEGKDARETQMILNHKAAIELLVSPEDLERFVALVLQEFDGLHEGNIARYRIRLSEFRRWKDAKRT